MAKAVLTQTKYQEKLGKLEKEILKLKKGASFDFPPKIISLKGVLKGVDISEKDIETTKKSLFKKL